MDKLVLFGCGGHARSIVNTILSDDKYIEVLLVDENAKKNEIILGCKVQKDYQLDIEDSYLVAIGNNKKRKEIYERLQEEKNGKNISVISKNASIGLEVTIGSGTFVAPNAYIGPQACIGNNTILNTSSVIEHEVTIGNHTHIAPNVTVCGRTKIGNEVFCGAGSTIIDDVYICDNVIIGAGAVVKENIEEAGIYAGVPARKIK